MGSTLLCLKVNASKSEDYGVRIIREGTEDFYC